MYTITLPDPDQNSLSPFHTYCVAVGSGNLDHTPVIDWFSKELVDLMKGKNYYCGQHFFAITTATSGFVPRSGVY